jgi:DNA-directed RNA polymerase specialized sigma24 family protein
LEEVNIHTDDTLLALMANDDKDAFTMLYRRYWESMFLTAAKALRSQDDAGDMVQEVFLSLWNRRRELAITWPSLPICCRLTSRRMLNYNCN